MLFRFKFWRLMLAQLYGCVFGYLAGGMLGQQAVAPFSKCVRLILVMAEGQSLKNTFSNHIQGVQKLWELVVNSAGKNNAVAECRVIEKPI